MDGTMDTHITNTGQNEEALASQIFEHFCAASTMGKILSLFREMCRILKLKPTIMPEFYTKLKLKLAKSWRAQAVFKKLDARSSFKIYNKGRTCANCKVLIIGGGPCGLRTAIDAQFLGAKVVVIEKRDRMTRNNIVHLWPFVIQDLRNLGAKKFFGKFCAGSIDHISIRQLQFILLKVALIIGVEVHEGVGFEDIIEPRDAGNERFGWRASVTPHDHPVTNYEFDVLIAADGKRNTLQGFKRKEFRGKLAIAITANFINKHTKEEAAVPEISGTAFIFKQKFFLDLNKQFFIDLENLVYYKGETHYFVMTAKKQSLLHRNVLKKDHSETTSLLSRENINYDALRAYALDAAYYATNFELSKLEFAINHYGQPDVAVFDFTSMFAAENASRAIERLGHKLLVCLVGDGLLEPFWPTGSGCARGFLSALDACWALRSWAMGVHPLNVIAERESIYRLLAQTTPQSVASDFPHYTVDPGTRYKNLNKNAVLAHQVVGHFDTDDPVSKQMDLIELTTTHSHTKKRKRDSQVHPDTLLAWLKKQISIYSLELDDLTSVFKNGVILCAVLHRYRPDLIDIGILDANNSSVNLKLAFDIFEKEYNIPPISDVSDILDKNENSDRVIVMTYLSQIYYLFRGEIPSIRHAKSGSPEPDKKRSSTPRNSTNREPTMNNISANVRSGTQNLHRTSDSENVSSQKKPRKRRSSSRYHGQSIVERMRKLREKKHTGDQKKKETARNSLMARLEAKSLKMLESNDKPASSYCVDDDYNISSYRMNAPEFKSRVKDLEKLLYPEHDRSSGPAQKGVLGGEFSSRIKNIEDQIMDGSSAVTTKKPRDLLRAIGKIETSDWNFKQIEEKIQENQLGRPPAHGKEKVPKWDREQFLARQTKIVGHGFERQESCEGKFQTIDNSLKQLDRQLKEGNVLETGERGKNKVASLAGQFAKKPQNEEQQTVPKVNNNVKPVKVHHTKLDICFACKKTVYLMEKINPEDNLTFHKSCFKCHYCSITLKIGSYTYDRDGKFGYNFFCQHHFGMMGKIYKSGSGILTKAQIKDKKEHPSIEVPDSSIDTKPTVQILNRDETPERIEIENQTHDPLFSEEPCDEMDEDIWSDINFGNSAFDNESSGNGDGEESSSNDEDFSEALDDESDESDDDDEDDDDNDMSDDSHDDDYSTSSSDRFSHHEYSSGDEEGGSGTEGSEQRVAREQRRQEVAICAPPLTSFPTDTEVISSQCILDINHCHLFNVNFQQSLNCNDFNTNIQIINDSLNNNYGNKPPFDSHAILNESEHATLIGDSSDSCNDSDFDSCDEVPDFESILLSIGKPTSIKGHENGIKNTVEEEHVTNVKHQTDSQLIKKCSKTNIKKVPEKNREEKSNNVLKYFPQNTTQKPNNVNRSPENIMLRKKSINYLPQIEKFEQECKMRILSTKEVTYRKKSLDKSSECSRKLSVHGLSSTINRFTLPEKYFPTKNIDSNNHQNVNSEKKTDSDMISSPTKTSLKNPKLSDHKVIKSRKLSVPETLKNNFDLFSKSKVSFDTSSHNAQIAVKSNGLSIDIINSPKCSNTEYVPEICFNNAEILNKLDNCEDSQNSNGETYMKSNTSKPDSFPVGETSISGISKPDAELFTELVLLGNISLCNGELNSSIDIKNNSSSMDLCFKEEKEINCITEVPFDSVAENIEIIGKCDDYLSNYTENSTLNKEFILQSDENESDLDLARLIELFSKSLNELDSIIESAKLDDSIILEDSSISENKQIDFHTNVDSNVSEKNTFVTEKNDNIILNELKNVSDLDVKSVFADKNDEIDLFVKTIKGDTAKFSEAVILNTDTISTNVSDSSVGIYLCEESNSFIDTEESTNSSTEETNCDIITGIDLFISNDNDVEQNVIHVSNNHDNEKKLNLQYEPNELMDNLDSVLSIDKINSETFRNKIDLKTDDELEGESTPDISVSLCEESENENILDTKYQPSVLVIEQNSILSVDKVNSEMLGEISDLKTDTKSEGELVPHIFISLCNESENENILDLQSQSSVLVNEPYCILNEREDNSVIFGNISNLKTNIELEDKLTPHIIFPLDEELNNVTTDNSIDCNINETEENNLMQVESFVSENDIMLKNYVDADIENISEFEIPCLENSKYYSISDKIVDGDITKTDSELFDELVSSADISLFVGVEDMFDNVEYDNFFIRDKNAKINVFTNNDCLIPKNYNKENEKHIDMSNAESDKVEVNEFHNIVENNTDFVLDIIGTEATSFSGPIDLYTDDVDSIGEVNTPLDISFVSNDNNYGSEKCIDISNDKNEELENTESHNIAVESKTNSIMDVISTETTSFNDCIESKTDIDSSGEVTSLLDNSFVLNDTNQRSEKYIDVLSGEIQENIVSESLNISGENDTDFVLDVISTEATSLIGPIDLNTDVDSFGEVVSLLNVSFVSNDDNHVSEKCIDVSNIKNDEIGSGESHNNAVENKTDSIMDVISSEATSFNGCIESKNDVDLFDELTSCLDISINIDSIFNIVESNNFTVEDSNEPIENEIDVPFDADSEKIDISIPDGSIPSNIISQPEEPDILSSDSSIVNGLSNSSNEKKIDNANDVLSLDENLLEENCYNTLNDCVNEYMKILDVDLPYLTENFSFDNDLNTVEIDTGTSINSFAELDSTSDSLCKEGDSLLNTDLVSNPIATDIECRNMDNNYCAIEKCYAIMSNDTKIMNSLEFEPENLSENENVTCSNIDKYIAEDNIIFVPLTDKSVSLENDYSKELEGKAKMESDSNFNINEKTEFNMIIDTNTSILYGNYEFEKYDNTSNISKTDIELFDEYASSVDITLNDEFDSIFDTVVSEENEISRKENNDDTSTNFEFCSSEKEILLEKCDNCISHDIIETNITKVDSFLNTNYDKGDIDFKNNNKSVAASSPKISFTETSTSDVELFDELASFIDISLCEEFDEIIDNSECNHPLINVTDTIYSENINFSICHRKDLNEIHDNSIEKIKDDTNVLNIEFQNHVENNSHEAKSQLITPNKTSNDDFELLKKSNSFNEELYINYRLDDSNTIDFTNVSSNIDNFENSDELETGNLELQCNVIENFIFDDLESLNHNELHIKSEPGNNVILNAHNLNSTLQSNDYNDSSSDLDISSVNEELNSIEYDDDVVYEENSMLLDDENAISYITLINHDGILADDSNNTAFDSSNNDVAIFSTCNNDYDSCELLAVDFDINNRKLCATNKNELKNDPFEFCENLQENSLDSHVHGDENILIKDEFKEPLINFVQRLDIKDGVMLSDEINDHDDSIISSDIEVNSETDEYDNSITKSIELEKLNQNHNIDYTNKESNDSHNVSPDINIAEIFENYGLNDDPHISSDISESNEVLTPSSTSSDSIISDDRIGNIKKKSINEGLDDVSLFINVENVDLDSSISISDSDESNLQFNSIDNSNQDIFDYHITDENQDKSHDVSSAENSRNNDINSPLCFPNSIAADHGSTSPLNEFDDSNATVEDLPNSLKTVSETPIVPLRTNKNEKIQNIPNSSCPPPKPKRRKKKNRN